MVKTSEKTLETNLVKKNNETFSVPFAPPSQEHLNNKGRMVGGFVIIVPLVLVNKNQEKKRTTSGKKVENTNNQEQQKLNKKRTTSGNKKSGNRKVIFIKMHEKGRKRQEYMKSIK